MISTIEHAKTLGTFTYPKKFTALQHSKERIFLSYGIQDISPEEISISSDGIKVTLDINSICTRHVISSPWAFAIEYLGVVPEVDSFLSKHSDLMWETATPQLLMEFFSDFLSEVKKSEPYWMAAALSMLSPLVAALCYRRDHHGKQLDASVLSYWMPLHRYESLSRDDYPSEIIHGLKAYMGDYAKDIDGNFWDEESQTQHAYRTMMIAEACITGSGGAGGRPRHKRLSCAQITYEAPSQIKFFKASVHCDELRIELNL